MAGKVIVVGNRKGGVGKTTTVVVLAQALKERGFSVAVIDLDPQASLSECLAHDLVKDYAERHVEALMEKGLPANKEEPYIRQVSALTGRPDVPLALVPCSDLLWELEAKVADSSIPFGGFRGTVKTNWKNLLRQMVRDFDFVIIDTAPGRTAMALHAFAAAHLIIVPCDTGELSIRGLALFVRHLKKNRISDRRVVRILWTRYAEKDQLGEGKIAPYFKAAGIEPKTPNLIYANNPDRQNRGLIAHKSFASGILEKQPKRLESVYATKARQSMNELADAVLDFFSIGGPP